MPVADLQDLAARTLPVLGFLVMITIVAEIADLAGVFQVAASRLSRIGGGRVWVLWLSTCLLAIACTAVLSLDTAAVLLTPIVIVMCRRLGISPLPFVMATVWLANTASLFLPVSNLTNLLALHHIGSVGAYLRLVWSPALAATTATLVVLLALFRRHLRGGFRGGFDVDVPDRRLLITASVVCVLLGPAFVAGELPVIPATAAAAVLVVACLAWQPRLLGEVTVPVWITLGAAALFVVVAVAEHHGLTTVLAHLAGTGEGPLALARLTLVGAVGANAVNNLPAYLALETVAGAPRRLVALLIGVNVMPLVTVWASLATLLWRERCRRGGVVLPLRRMAAAGAVCALVAGAAAVAALVVS